MASKNQENPPLEFPVNEKERELLIGAFKGNEYLLKVMRALVFGFDVIKDDKELVRKTFSNIDLFNAVRKKIYPVLDIESPIGQITDYWIGTESQIFGASLDTIRQSVFTKKLLKEFLEKGLELLKNPDGETVSLNYEPLDIEISDPLAIRLMARNLYMKTMETGFTFIKVTAETPIQNPKEQKEKAVLNSNK